MKETAVASGSDAKRGLTKEDIQDEIKNISVVRARELLLKLLQEDPQAKKTMETEILLARNACKETGQSLEHEEWEGKYILDCPNITQGWGYEDREFSLTIYSSSTGLRLWISFDLGIISGVMRSERGLPRMVGERVTTEWRGREDGEGVMTFEGSNCATLTFLGDGNIEGELGGDFAAGMARFTGSKVNNRLGNLKSQVKKLKTEFRNYNWHNYEVENKERWGKWGGEQRAESAYESDTSAGTRIQSRKRKRRQ